MLHRKQLTRPPCRYRSTEKDFISTLLGKEVMELQLVPNEPAVDKIDEVQMSFDVSVVFDDGERADLEMIW